MCSDRHAALRVHTTCCPRVLVVQSGARHSYALPAAFAEAGMLEAFYTDMCAGRGLGRIAAVAEGVPLPASMRSLAERLAERRPPASVLARTRTDDLETIRYRRIARLLCGPAEQRMALVDHVVRRGRRMAQWGTGGATHLFNILGEGGALVVSAKARGLPILSDIMIALSTDAIEMAEYVTHPDWGPPPPAALDANGSGFDPTRHLLETTDVFVCPSRFVADDLVENWGVSPEATRIVPYGLSPTWFGVATHPTPGRVLFVGTANRRKGIHYVAIAANDLMMRKRHYEFRVAGDAHQAVREHSAAKRLSFLGRVTRAAAMNEFASADILVLPTLAEGSATVVYEAMAAGVPVVTTRAAGSLIENGVDGIIVPERDPEALMNAIERLVEDRELRQRMSAAARRNARRWNWQSYASALVSLVRETPSPIPSRS